MATAPAQPALTSEGLCRPPPEAGGRTFLSEQWILPPLQGLLGLIAQLQVGLRDCREHQRHSGPPNPSFFPSFSPSVPVISISQGKRRQNQNEDPSLPTIPWPGPVQPAHPCTLLPYVQGPSPFLCLKGPTCLSSSPVLRRGKCSGGSLGRLGTGGKKLLSMERAAPSVSRGSRVLQNECQGCFRGVGTLHGHRPEHQPWDLWGWARWGW